MTPARAAFNREMRELQALTDYLTGAHNSRVYERGARVVRDYRAEALNQQENQDARHDRQQ
jgi:hypothetical protein